MTDVAQQALDVRRPDHAIEDLILQRWSPRAMSGDSLPPAQLMRLFEAARWAPSSGNQQPWRFVYATRDSAGWSDFLGLLDDGNREWAHRAAALIIVVSRTTSEPGGRELGTHAFDTGAAWENLALQGVAQGLVIHGMAGFDYGRAREVAGVPDGFDVQAMVAVGLPGDPDDLSERRRNRERPSSRRPLHEIVFEERFPASEDDAP
ncbi:MAG: nitroreductase family protein [Armatimonadota bacterium]